MDLFDARKELHLFLDPLWQTGTVTRDEMYDKIERLTGKRHIAELTIEEIVKVAQWFAEAGAGFPCHICKHFVCLRYGIPVCLKKVKRGGAVCGRFKVKKDI